MLKTIKLIAFQKIAFLILVIDNLSLQRSYIIEDN